MNPSVERTIIRYYPHRALVSPLSDDAIRWDYDPDYKLLKALLADLKALDPEVHPGTRGDYDISEEQVLLDDLHLQLSYLGPYAALNYRLDIPLDEDRREVVGRLKSVLDKHGVALLSDAELSEAVPWISEPRDGSAPATVWSCLFVNDLDHDEVPPRKQTAPPRSPGGTNWF